MPKQGPNLFIIGASKSGSSALHSYLQPISDVSMSSEKEPCYFVNQDELRSAWPVRSYSAFSYDWNAYCDLWKEKPDAKYRCEASVFYSQAPHRSGVPQRIKEACPDSRFIYVVREPVSRTISHYWQRAKEFKESGSLNEAVIQNALYRDSSDYALQLEYYFEHFSPTQFHIIIAENLRNNTRGTMDELLKWLEVPSYNYSDDELVLKHISPTTSRRQRFPFIDSARDSKAWQTLRKKLPQFVVDKLRQSTTVQFDRSEINDERAKVYLSRYFQPRIEKFEYLTGLNLTDWKK